MPRPLETTITAALRAATVLTLALAALGAAGATASEAIAQPAAAPTGTTAPTVVLVMRHAERVAEPGADPALSEAGRSRALSLSEAARDARVSAVFTTQYRRTRETGEPLARLAGVPVTERPVTGANAARYTDELVREIREEHAGRTVAVIGHSNTVPALVAALAGGPAPSIGESDYGDLFVVIIPAGGGPARVLRTRVGS